MQSKNFSNSCQVVGKTAAGSSLLQDEADAALPNLMSAFKYLTYFN